MVNWKAYTAISAVIWAAGFSELQAAEFNLTIDGSPAPQVLKLAPYDEVDFAVGVTGELGGGGLAVVLSSSVSHLDWSNISFNESVSLGLEGVTYQTGNWDNFWAVTAGSTAQEIYFSGGHSTLNGQGPFTLMDGLIYQCDYPFDVIINLVAAGNGIYYYDANGEPVIEYQPGAILDCIYVIQPEPHSLSILALGGLISIRRKRN